MAKCVTLRVAAPSDGPPPHDQPAASGAKGREELQPLEPNTAQNHSPPTP